MFVESADGWSALYQQCWLMLNGKSHIYNLHDTLVTVGVKYSDGDEHWAENVAAFLGVPTSTTLLQLAV